MYWKTSHLTKKVFSNMLACLNDINILAVIMSGVIQCEIIIINEVLHILYVF